MSGNNCTRCGVRVGWIGLAVGGSLVGIKLVVGFKTGSRALMADALYSIMDVVSAFLVITSLKISRKGVDDDHPYGRGKVEFLAIATVSLCIGAFAFMLLHRVIDDLVTSQHRSVEPLAAATAAVAILCCAWVWRYAHCAGERLGSPIIKMHAEHNKADVISSTAVLVGICLSWLGLGMLDPLVALFEIVHILWMSWTLLRSGMLGLLDATPSIEQTANITQIAKAVPGVVGVDHVRARNVGSSLWIELSLRVGGKRRMAEVGQIRSRVRSAITARIARVANIMVEILPTTSADQGLLPPQER